jgi:hypothetical protein
MPFLVDEGGTALEPVLEFLLVSLRLIVDIADPSEAISFFRGHCQLITFRRRRGDLILHYLEVNNF